VMPCPACFALLQVQGMPDFPKASRHSAAPQRSTRTHHYVLQADDVCWRCWLRHGAWIPTEHDELHTVLHAGVTRAAGVGHTQVDHVVCALRACCGCVVQVQQLRCRSCRSAASCWMRPATPWRPHQNTHLSHVLVAARSSRARSRTPSPSAPTLAHRAEVRAHAPSPAGASLSSPCVCECVLNAHFTTVIDYDRCFGACGGRTVAFETCCLHPLCQIE